MFESLKWCLGIEDLEPLRKKEINHTISLRWILLESLVAELFELDTIVSQKVILPHAPFMFLINYEVQIPRSSSMFLPAAHNRFFIKKPSTGHERLEAERNLVIHREWLDRAFECIQWYRQNFPGHTNVDLPIFDWRLWESRAVFEGAIEATRDELTHLLATRPVRTFVEGY